MQQYLIYDAKNQPEQAFSLLELFEQFAAQPWSMLLDSAEANHPNSRYQIMVAEPAVTLVSQHGTTTLTDEHGSHHYTLDPFKVLDCALKRYFPKVSESFLPFCGGALGYFGYDLGRYIEKMPSIAKAELKLPDMAVGLYQWALIFDQHTKQLWFSDYSGHAEQNWYKLQQRLSPNAPSMQPFTLTSAWQANMSQAEYHEKFDRVQAELKSGNCYQINLAQRFHAKYAGDEWHAYRLLREKNTAPFSAFIRLPHAAVISISPERFLQLHAGAIETKPIKGTKPRGTCPATDQAEADALQLSDKDRAENVMIVDLLRNDIGKVSEPGSVKVPALFAIESFPAVHHLVSTITGTLAAPYRACDLLRGAFPGGSITGAPKISAMQIIEQLEPHRRHVYCGAIGYINSKGDMDTNITIRTLVCEEQHIYCWAGGGVVADSDARSEYQETLDKVAKILPVLSAT
ncbi:aminodeoxychorismate synthase component I [Alishewanella tabrizica]|uniref:aminodeoxychorismate synthase n=1 Tax=Alishewanella tabrizica TaxID=671278 RepID=A0ABQ2WT54_9ALTE|nr:aminodeoxychorismate synthase component I [Alishewanella tabrizica]GGW71001.1 aminodeoxychorismate synthase, component I [Alishewanella tabrizica]